MAKGKKVCPGCEQPVGLRTKICACGHDFGDVPTIKSSDKPKGEAQKESVNFASAIGFRGNVILAPAGTCPHRIYDLTLTDIGIWCQLVVFTGLSTGSLYSVKALRYWLREFYEIGSADHKTAGQYIDLWYNQLISRS
jgi:hypothetical protein